MSVYPRGTYGAKIAKSREKSKNNFAIFKNQSEMLPLFQDFDKSVNSQESVI